MTRAARFYRTLVENALDVITVLDPRGRILFDSPSIETVLGYDPVERLGQSAVSFVHPEDRDKMLALFSEGVASPDARIPSLARVRHKDGTWRFFEGVGRNLLDDPDVAGVVITQRDVTARRQADLAMRESQRALLTLMANLPGMAYRCRNDAQRSMDTLSEGCLALTGYPPSYLLNGNLSYAEIIHPEDRDRVARDVQAAVREARPFDLNYRICTASGDVKRVWEQGRGVGPVQPDVGVLEGYVTDVTRLANAEDAARAAQARLRHLVVSTPVVIYALDWPTWRPTWVSDCLPRVTGHPSDVALNDAEWWSNGLHPRDRAAALERSQALGQTTDRLAHEYRFRHRDGHYVWIRDELRLERDEAGEPLELVGAWADVTRLKRLGWIQAIQFAATRALAEAVAEDPLPQLLQAVTETLEWDLGEFWELVQDGSRLRRAASWARPGLEEFDRLSRDRSFSIGEGFAGWAWSHGESLWSADVPAETNFFRGPWARAARLHAAFAFPVRGPSGNSGVLLFLNHERIPRDDELLAAMQDLGWRIGAFLERRRGEIERQRQRDALVKSEKMADLGRLAAGIAHELRNPLAVIVARVDILLKHLARATPPDAARLRDGLGKLREAGERMSRIVQGLSTSSKPSLPEPQRLDLAAFLRGTLELVAYKAREHRVSLAVDVAEGLPPVLGDRSQVTQILVNLASNAIEAMGEGGGQLTLRVRPAGASLLVDVADTGPGIPPEVLERIWEPFYTTKAEGTGLGLSIVRGLVEAQPGATLAVESRVGLGTTFTLSLTIAPESGEASPA